MSSNKDKDKYKYKKKGIEYNEVKQDIGTVGWYIVFIIIIPYILRSETNLRLYLPMIDLIANVFSTSGRTERKLFHNLYKLTPDNIISFVSTNFINLLALSGVALNGTHVLIKTGQRTVAIIVMLVMYSITYLLPSQGLNWIIKRIQHVIDNFILDKEKQDTHWFIFRMKRFMKQHSIWFDYIGGFLVVIILVLLETFLIKKYLNWIVYTP